MFAGVLILRYVWEIYCDLNLAGKIILFPLFLAIAIVWFVFGVCETLLIDVWVIIIFLFLKSHSVKDVFEFYWC